MTIMHTNTTTTTTTKTMLHLGDCLDLYRLTADGWSGCRRWLVEQAEALGVAVSL